MADIFIWLDDVQMSHQSFINRVQLKSNPSTSWLTIPISRPKSKQSIRALEVGKPGWQNRHILTIKHSLTRYPYGHQAVELAEQVLLKPEQRSLSATIIHSTEALARAIGGLPANILYQSDFSTMETGWERVLEIVKEAGGTQYISAAGGANYLDHHAFEQAGIDVSYIDYEFTPWFQKYGDFTPYVSGLDLLAAAGPDARQHLKSNVRPWREFLSARNHASRK